MLADLLADLNPRQLEILLSNYYVKDQTKNEHQNDDLMVVQSRPHQVCRHYLGWLTMSSVGQEFFVQRAIIATLRAPGLVMLSFRHFSPERAVVCRSLVRSEL